MRENCWKRPNQASYVEEAENNEEEAEYKLFMAKLERVLGGEDV